MSEILEEVNIKKEVEDVPETPECSDAQDSSTQKPTKGWTDEETRSLIEVAKIYIPKTQDPKYSALKLAQDITTELQIIGFQTTPEKVRCKLRNLRKKFLYITNYNAKHVNKRPLPFAQELSSLYGAEYIEEPVVLNGHGLSDFSFSTEKQVTEKSVTIPASHVDLRTVVTPKKKKKKIVLSKSKFGVKKKVVRKSQGQQPFQCGLCFQKFHTIERLGQHTCGASASSAAKANVETPKKKQTPNSLSDPSAVFHWNSLSTMQLLEFLKVFQETKGTNVRKGNIWSHIGSLMRKKGHAIQAKDLEKKWSVLTTAFMKTLVYNRVNKDKKKCAFFKRLTDLYEHPTSFECFSSAPKMASNQQPMINQYPPTAELHKPNSTNQNGSFGAEILTFMQNTWKEYKEIERRKHELAVHRHNEIMEMLSYLSDIRSGE